MGSANPSVYASGSGRSLSATVTWYEGPEVTVSVTSDTSWRLVTRGNSSDIHLSSSYATDSYSDTFNADDGGEYIFQIYDPLEGSYYNNDFATSGFTVDFGDDSGGDSGGGEVVVQPCGYLIVNQGEGTILHVRRSWPPERTCHTDLQTGEPIYNDGKDCFYFYVEVLDGYELDYYEFEGEQLGYALENFRYYKTDESNPDVIYYMPEYDGNVSVTSTATPIATVRIYNKNSSDWDRYAPYIYDGNSSNWYRYVPYVYNSGSSSWDRYS